MNSLKATYTFIILLFFMLNYGTSQAQFTCQDFDIALTSSNISPASDGYFYICPNDVLQLNLQGNYLNNGIEYTQSDATTDFIWYTFGSDPQGTNPLFEISYPDAGIYPILCQATDINGCINTNDLIFYVIVSGPTEMEITASLPDETYCLGDSITLTANPTFDSLVIVDIDTISFTYNNDSLLFLPDGTGETFVAPIEVPQYMDNPNFILENMVVCVDIEHSFLGDLDIQLTCPDGNSMILHEFSNFSGGGYYLGEPIDIDSNPTPGVPYTYCWTPDATNGTWLESDGLAAQNGGTLPPGNYSPYGTFDSLYNCDKSGTWTLSIMDNWGSDNGFLFSWTLGFIVNDSLIFEDISYDTISYITQVTNQYWELPDGSQINANEIDIEIMGPTYTYHIEDQTGCDITYDFDMSFAADLSCGINCITYPNTDTTFYFCYGDTITFEGVDFYTTGNYSITPENPDLYCDNPIINVIVNVSPESFYPNFDIIPSTGGQNNGLISLVVTPFSNHSMIYDSMEVSIIDSLYSGEYIVEVSDGICSEFDTLFVPNICIPYPHTDTSFTLCLGDTITFEGIDITSSGTYTINPENLDYYCNDDINVTVIGDTLNYTLDVIPSLAGENNGSIEILTAGYVIIDDTSEITLLDSLATGDYIIEISNGNCSQIDTVFVDEYLLLMATVIVNENIVSTSSYSATVNVTGGWGDYLIEWSTGDSGSDITLYDLAPGFYSVTVTDELGNEITVYFEVEDTSATYDPSIFKTANIYPNPTSDILNIEYQFHQSVDYSLSFYNILGKEIFNRNGQSNEIITTQDLGGLPSGVYLMNISIDGKSWVERVVVE